MSLTRPSVLSRRAVAKPSNPKRVFEDPETTALCQRSLALRLYWGLTQVELAKAAGVPRPTIALLETNRARGTSKRLRRGLAQAYGVPDRTLDAYLAGRITEVDVLRVSTRTPVPRLATEEAQGHRKRGRPAGQLTPGAWRDSRVTALIGGDGSPDSRSGKLSVRDGAGRGKSRGTTSLGSARPDPRRLSYASTGVADEWERFPNLAHAVDLVADHTGADLAAVEQSALALALTTTEGTDRSVLAWAHLLESMVTRLRSGTRFNPRRLPALREAIQRASAKVSPPLVERAAVEASRRAVEPRSLDTAAWLELIEACLVSSQGVADARTPSTASTATATAREPARAPRGRKGRARERR